ILATPLHDVVGCDAAQIADVADVFDNRKIGVQAECLSQIACLGACFARWLTKNLSRSGACFHDPGENLERRSFSRTIGADQAEDLAFAHLKTDSANGFEFAVALPELANSNGD